MKILLFMPKGVEMLEASAFLDVFGWHRDLLKGSIEVITCGLTKQVVSAFGLKFEVDCLIDAIDIGEYEALVLPGGFGYHGFYEEAYDPRLLAMTRRFHEADKWLVGVCVGALIMGKSGILEGRKATTYHLMNGKRQKQLMAFGAKIGEGPLVVDGRLITSWCPQTAPEVALKLLEHLTSTHEALQIRGMMGYDVK